jgi:hypothetical protein
MANDNGNDDDLRPEERAVFQADGERFMFGEEDAAPLLAAVGAILAPIEGAGRVDALVLDFLDHLARDLYLLQVGVDRGDINDETVVAQLHALSERARGARQVIRRFMDARHGRTVDAMLAGKGPKVSEASTAERPAPVSRRKGRSA